MTIALLDIESSGLNAYTDRVTCIGMIIEETGEEIALSDESEKELLTQFFKLVEEKNIEIVIAYNGFRFDFPFLQIRVLKHQLKEKFDIAFEDIICKDIKDDFLESSFPVASSAYPIYRKPSLDETARFFEIPLRKTGDGKQAVIMWSERRIDELKAYCLNDVKILKAIFEKIEKSHAHEEKKNKK